MKNKTQEEKTDEIYESIKSMEKKITLFTIIIDEKIGLFAAITIGVCFAKNFLGK